MQRGYAIKSLKSIQHFTYIANKTGRFGFKELSEKDKSTKVCDWLPQITQHYPIFDTIGTVDSRRPNNAAQ